MGLAAGATTRHDRSHFIGYVLPSTPGTWPAWSRALLICLSLVGYATAVRSFLQSLDPTVAILKDIKWEYLFAKAVLHGDNPYVALTELSERYFPQALPYSYDHPAAHPPLVAALVAPLGLLPFEVAAGAWYIFEVVLLYIVGLMLVRHQTGRINHSGTLLLIGLLFLWEPVSSELSFGQLTIPMAACLLGSWLAYRSQRPGLAGFLLGLATSIKLIPAVIILYFVVKREWKVAAWAVWSAAIMTLLACLVLGKDATQAYFTTALLEGGHWRAAVANYSVFGIVSHVLMGTLDFDGQAMVFDKQLIFSPIIRADWLTMPVSGLLCSVLLALAIRTIARAGDPDGEIALLICTLLLISPVTWQYYLVLLLWPAYIAGSRLRRRGWPKADTNRLVGAIILLSAPAFLIAIAGLLIAAAVSGGTTPYSAIGILPLLLLPGGILLMYSVVSGEMRAISADHRWPSAPK